CFLGVAPTKNPVFKSWDISPAMADIIHITVPTDNAPIIPASPSNPIALNIALVIRSVAIVIPDTGLLLLPTNPTSLAETVAKKNPNSAIIIAPAKPTGIIDVLAINIIKAITPINATFPDISSSVLRFVIVPFDSLNPPIASLKVLNINGNDLIKLNIPPKATAPAPIYLK